MNGLTDFLLARIAEDEEWGHLGDGTDFVPAGYWDNARVLAECEAKRQVVGRFADVVDAGFDACGDGRVTLGHLAAVYADHPDFDPAWRAEVER